jgi:hypothetical protein
LADQTDLTPVLDFARVCMLRDRVVIDLDTISSLVPAQRCMLVARVMKATVSVDAEMRTRFAKDGLMDKLRDEATHRLTVQQTDIT